METEIYKIRSFGSCIQTAYDLFGKNLKTIFRRTWLPVIAVALLAALTAFVSLPQANLLESTSQLMLEYGRYFLATGIIVLLMVVVSVWLNTTVVSLLNGRNRAKNAPRVIRLTLLFVGLWVTGLAITGIASGIPYLFTSEEGAVSPMTPFYALTLGTVIFLLFVAFLIPTFYSSFKYLMEPEQKLSRVLGKSYRIGLRHWGFLFVLFLLVVIIVAIIFCISQMPSVILATAKQFDNNGLSLGDATGLPSYFAVLTFAATFICQIIWMYVIIWADFVYYFAYGSIEAKLRQIKKS